MFAQAKSENDVSIQLMLCYDYVRFLGWRIRRDWEKL